MAMTLEELRDAVERDFSKNILVSHGLFRSPHPLGAHLFCEVDTGRFKNMEFVLRVVPFGAGGSTSHHIQSVIKLVNTLHRETTLYEANFESLLEAVDKFKHCSNRLKHILNNEGIQLRIYQLCLSCTHPNIVPLIGAFMGQGNLFLVFPAAPYTLKSMLHFSPNALGDEWQLRLLIYEIIAGLAHCHGRGISHGNINPSNVLISNSMWCCLTGFTSKVVDKKEEPGLANQLEFKTEFKKWWRGELSNYDYLLLLNRLAGRRWGDRCFHTVMPWVIDFTTKPDEGNDTGWRDLTKSKWRLAKGDEQLDFTYSTADIPHHVSDECLSELAVCIYKARRMPLPILRRVVRSVYEPNEYPANMQRLYQWTPDECIPEFYSDPEVFHSINKGMGDLEVPSWARDAEEFIAIHRAALESERVSKQIHHWIDLTFGFKLTGEAAVSAKNVTLSTIPPHIPRASGRRQLFTRPHPPRRSKDNLYTTVEELEESSFFCESVRALSPWYGQSLGSFQSEDEIKTGIDETCEAVLENITEGEQKTWSELFRKVQLEHEDEEIFYQRLIAWQNEVFKSNSVESKMVQESTDKSKMVNAFPEDVFSVGCLIAELYLRRPLFDLSTAASWYKTGELPSIIHQLPFHVRVLVETTIQAEIKIRASAQMLLESPFFPSAVRSAYAFLSAFHMLKTKQDRLHYSAKMAQHLAFQVMGAVSSELCAPSCLSVFTPPYTDLEHDDVTILFKSLLQVLTQQASRRLLVPIVQNILQDNEAVNLKTGLLATSFIRNFRRIVGTSVYLQHIHGLIVLNVLRNEEGGAASVVLVDTCRDLGLPISLHQTVMPLFQSLGRDISVFGIGTLVEIGQRFGKHAIIKHWLPPLRYILMLGLESSSSDKAGPTQSWRLLAAVDALAALDRLVTALSPNSIVKELLQEPNNTFMRILQRKNLPHTFLENAGKTLLSACNQAGPELTCVHVISQLKQLFDKLALGKDAIVSNGNKGNLVYILYPGLASLLGIEKVRQAFPTWLLIEQGLGKKFNWKWTDMNTRHTQAYTPSEEVLGVPVNISPTNLLLNGVGWSVPQSEATKWTTTVLTHRNQPSLVPRPGPGFEPSEDPWFWLPAQDESFGGAESASRIGLAHAVTKDEHSWKLNAVVAHSWRAHSGSTRASKLGEDECVIYTAGGLRGKSVVRKWDLSTTKCIMEYSGHEEVVNNICVLQGYERVASCDGTLHIWNSETGKLVALLDECGSENRAHTRSEGDVISLSNGILSGGNLYTSMHFMEHERKLVLGTASGYLRFIDTVGGRQLYSWRCEPSTDTCLSSFISSVSSGGYSEDKASKQCPWIAIGFSSGHCSLLDLRSGSVLGHWRAHAAEVTSLASLEDNYLVSSSLDRTICIWDLRRSWPLQPQTFQGHTDGVTSFALWGTNILSAAGNKIGVSSFSKLMHHGQTRQVINPRKIYTADRTSRNLSIINTITVLPFSRQFVIGTDDGLLKICV